MSRVTSRLAAVLVLAIPVVGRAAEPLSDYKHLQPAEWLIGDWVAEYDMPIDFGQIKQGDRVVSHVSRRWALGRNTIVLDSRLEAGGKAHQVSHEVTYWDPVAGKAALWGQSGFGTAKGAFRELGDRVVLDFSTHVEGELAGTAVLERIDDNAHTWQIVDLTARGDKMPDWPKVTYRRKMGTAAGDLWAAYREMHLGSWVTQGALQADVPQLEGAKGDSTIFEVTWRPANAEATMVGEGSFRIPERQQEFAIRSISYWDPAAANIRLIASWSNGAVEDVVIDTQTADGFLGTYTRKVPDAETFRARFRITYTDADTYVIAFLSGPQKGEILAEWKRQK